MGADQKNHAAPPPHASGPSRRQVLQGAGAGLGAAALAPLLGLGEEPAEAAQARLTARAAANRITDFGQGWRFALVNPDGITDPTGAYANAMDPGFDDSGWQQLDVPHDWSIELTPVDNASTSSATGFLPGRPGLVPQALHAAHVPGGPADLGRVRRRVPQLERVPERQAARQPPLRLHRLQLRPDRPGAHRRRHRGRDRGQRGRPAAEQPLVLRRRHLPQRLPGHHRPGPRGAARHVRDHARPARHAQLRLRDRPGGHRRRQRGIRRGVGAGGGDPHQPGGEDRRAGQHDGQRPRRADPDRHGQPEGDQPRAVVHGPSPALHRADRPGRGRHRRRHRRPRRSASGTSRSTRPRGSRSTAST